MQLTDSAVCSSKNSTDSAWKRCRGHADGTVRIAAMFGFGGGPIEKFSRLGMAEVPRTGGRDTPSPLDPPSRYSLSRRNASR